jgi:carotenoid cleavage dioxygenase-like enzyme
MGTGMVHGVALRDGRAAWYRNRWVRDAEVAAARGLDRPPGDRAEDGTVNTHVIGVDGRTFALVEAGSHPMELSDELETVARSDFGGTLEGSFSAHTHADPATGDLHAISYHWSWDHVRHVVVGPDARVRREEKVAVEGGPMIHDCAITERYVVIFDLPVAFDLDAAMAGVSLPYLWAPHRPPRVGLLPLTGAGDEVRWFEAPTCYVFHTLNAYDTPSGDVVVDVVRHPRMFDRVTNGPDEGAAVLERWTVPAGSTPTAAGGSAVRVATLDDRGQEFPRIDERLTGRKHRYGYGALVDALEHGPIVKHDLDAGTSEVHSFGAGRSSMEPVFVPRPGGTAEDDGWVMSYVHDATTGLCDVVILDAGDLTAAPVATVHLPARVPFGFHGSWAPDA